MSPQKPQHVTLIGVGLLGGSIGLGLKRRHPDWTVAGVGRRQCSLDAALAVGAIDEAHLDPADCVARSDLIILCTPVGAFECYLKAIRPLLKKSCLVTDVGSTKGQVVRIAERIVGRGGPFVGSHPMAGNEKKGPQHADPALLDGALCIVTPTAHTPPRLAKRAEALWCDLGMRTTRMTPAAHDRATARVSHLPHVLSSLLMLLPTEAELPAAATGFADMTRLAAGDPEMWRDILLTNAKPIAAALRRMGRDIDRLAEQVEAGDARAIEKMLQCAQRRRRG